MKVKLLNILIVCLVTLGLIAPAIVVFGLIWKEHLELIKAQPLVVYELNIAKEREVPKFLLLSSVSAAHKQGIVRKETVPSFPRVTLLKKLINPTGQKAIGSFLLEFSFFSPFSVCLGISLYERHRVYRAAVFQKQVEFLERLWQQSI